MKGRLISGALMFAALAPASRAQSNFDGTWKVDFESALPTKINVWLLQNGTYKCISCTPSIEVKTDGTDQPVKRQPFDTISVAVLDRQTVREIEKKNGQIVSDEQFTVSADGNTVADEFANWQNDRVDARKLAELLHNNQLRPVYHGDHELRTLKELVRSYLQRGFHTPSGQASRTRSQQRRPLHD